jgi:O-antigen/teichoic acid export membrane protein
MIDEKWTRVRGYLSRVSASFAARIFKNSGWGMAGNVIAVLTGLLQVGLVGRTLGVEQYGVFAVITVFPSMVQQFAGFRTAEMVTRYSTIALQEGQRAEAGHIAQLGWAIDVLIGLLTVLVVCFGGGLYLQATLGSTRDLTLLYLYSLVTLISAPVSTSQAILRVLDRFDLQLAPMIVANVLRVLLIAAAYFAGAGLVGITLAYLLASVASSATSLYLCSRQARGRLEFQSGRAPWRYGWKRRRQLSSFLGAGYLEASIHALSRNFDTVLLASLSGTSQVGLYRAAQSLVHVFAGFVAPMTSAALPDLQRTISTPRRILRRRLTHLTVVAGVVLVPGAAILSVAAPWLITLIMGPDFEQAAASARIMLWATAYAGTLFWLPTLMLCLGRQWLRTLALLIAMLCQIGLLYLLAPSYGQVGAAWAYFGLYAVFNSILLLWLIIRPPKPAAQDTVQERLGNATG